MKKREKKLQLHRETVLQLDSLAKAGGGTGDMWTGCMSECTECGTTTGQLIEQAH